MDGQVLGTPEGDAVSLPAGLGVFAPVGRPPTSTASAAHALPAGCRATSLCGTSQSEGPSEGGGGGALSPSTLNPGAPRDLETRSPGSALRKEPGESLRSAARAWPGGRPPVRREIRSLPIHPASRTDGGNGLGGTGYHWPWRLFPSPWPRSWVAWPGRAVAMPLAGSVRPGIRSKGGEDRRSSPPLPDPATPRCARRRGQGEEAHERYRSGHVSPGQRPWAQGSTPWGGPPSCWGRLRRRGSHLEAARRAGYDTPAVSYALGRYPGRTLRGGFGGLSPHL